MVRSWAPFLSLLALAGCVEETGLPAGQCEAAIWAVTETGSQELSVLGSWDDYETAISMSRFDDTWFLASFGLEPGEYGYLVVEAGAGRVDDYNGLSTFRATDGREVSLLRVEDCSVPSVVPTSAREVDSGAVLWDLQFEPARSGHKLDPDSVSVDIPGAVVDADAESGDIVVRVAGLGPGKHRITVDASDVDGVAAAPAQAVGWVQRRVREPEERVIYQIMIDRFRGDSGEYLGPPPNPGARAGGTLDGIVTALDEGYFDTLGITTLWLSPVYLNPDEARAGVDGNLYEGYHGYWPLDARGVDPRIGGETGFDTLISMAHERGLEIVLDIVPNHLYEANPRVAALETSDGLHVSDPLCVCGTPACPWSGNIERCWFTPYLPDLNHQNPEVLQMVIDDADWWARRFDLDGFRVDAVPMMPRAVTRRVVDVIRRQQGPSGTTFNIGEIFTGPGRGGTEVIRFYLGPDGLDSAFDFPLMWSMRDVLAHGSSGFEAIESTLVATDGAIEGSGSLMARIIGNHDVTRFISEVVGDAGVDPWGTPRPIQPDDPEAYRRQTLAMGLMLTIPGIPVIYYGDEIGLAGGSDPDNRRVMPDLQGLSDDQRLVLDATRTLAVTRRCLPSLRTGTREAVVVGPRDYAFVRDAGDGAPALVAMTTRNQMTSLNVREGVVVAGEYVDVLTGETFTLGGQVVQLPMEPSSLRVLIPSEHVCATLVQ